MIPNIFVLFSFYLTIIISLIGYGYLFERLFYREILESNFGYTGLRGIFLLIFYSFLSHFFFAHGYIHNVILTLLGVIFFTFYILKTTKKKEYPSILLANFFILFIGIIIFKTHDDFPFYHLQQSLNFSQNKIQLGMWNLDFSYAHATVAPLL